MPISIQFLDISSNILNGKKRKVKFWIKNVIEKGKKIDGEISIIITSKKELLKINKKYLNHNYDTDVITFNYNENKIVSGDIFISLQQVKENAKIFNVSNDQELLRVIIHGVLHLLGFNDKTESEKKQMKVMENKSLTIY